MGHAFARNDKVKGKNLRYVIGLFLQDDDKSSQRKESSEKDLALITVISQKAHLPLAAAFALDVISF